MQVPPGPSDMVCPFHRKTMDRVCHKCPLWVQLRGEDAQTGEPISNEWQCGFTAQIFQMNDLIRRTGQHAQKADKLHTAIDKFHTSMAKLQVASLKQLEGHNDRPRRIEPTDAGTAAKLDNKGR